MSERHIIQDIDGDGVVVTTADPRSSSGSSLSLVRVAIRGDSVCLNHSQALELAAVLERVAAEVLRHPKALCGDMKYKAAGQDVCVATKGHDGDHVYIEHDCAWCGVGHGTCKWCGTTHGDSHGLHCRHSGSKVSNG